MPDRVRPPTCDCCGRTCPRQGRRGVLITSNRQSVTDLGTQVGVEVFTPAEAAAFLAGVHRAGRPCRSRGAGRRPGLLAAGAGLGGGGVIRGQHLAYGTYLQRLRSLPVAEYLTRGPTPAAISTPVRRRTQRYRGAHLVTRLFASRCPGLLMPLMPRFLLAGEWIVGRN